MKKKLGADEGLNNHPIRGRVHIFLTPFTEYLPSIYRVATFCKAGPLSSHMMTKALRLVSCTNGVDRSRDD